MVEGDELVGKLITIGTLCIFVGIVVAYFCLLLKYWWETKDFGKRR